MKTILPVILFACVSSVVAQTNFALQTNAQARNRLIDIDGYAAKVNDRVITLGEVREAMGPLIYELYQNYQGEEFEREWDKAFRRTRDELVAQALILEAFETRGGQIPDQYINDEVDRVIKERFKGDEAQFEQMLALQKTSRSEFEETVRDQMIVNMMVNEEVRRRARVTPEQIRQAYEAAKQDYLVPEEVKYSLIVLNKGETPEEEEVKQAEAETTRRKLLDGADFAETAKAVSEGGRASEGGQFSWMQPQDARAELRETLQTLPVGEISGIIDTGQQLYIVKVDARRQATYKAFEDVRDEIRSTLLTAERERLHRRWIERLEQNNYVVIYD